MKKTLLILLVAVASLTACKKDKKNELVGRWDLNKENYTETSNGKTVEGSDTYNLGETYFVFTGSNYELYYDNELEESGTFSVTENSLSFTNSKGASDFGNVTFHWNSETEFVLNFERIESVYSYKSEMFFNKN